MRRNGWLIIAALFVIGVYAPTSIERVISTELQFVSLGVLFVLIALLLARRNGVTGGAPLICALSIPALMMAFTLLSPFTEFAYGAMLTYALLAMILALRIDNLGLPNAFPTVILGVSWLNIAVATALLLQLPEVRDAVLDSYSASYSELVTHMLGEGKPVLSFASHSIAGFYFYLFFFLNFETYRRIGGGLHLAAALCHIVLMITLTSYTGYLFGLVGFVQVVKQFLWHRSVLKAAVAALALMVASASLAATLDLAEVKEALIDRVLTAESSGLSGRYSSTGALSGNLSFIAENPFQPIGLGYSRNLFYGDSGPVEYLTRGSFPLLVAIYSGLYLFFRRNLRSPGMAAWLFAVYFAFEIGYSNLNYFRTLYLLPVVVVYLNNVARRAEC